MKVVFWKKYLSQFLELPVETRSTNKNPSLKVTIFQGEYTLSTPNAVFSQGRSYGNFRQAFEKIDFDKLPVKNVLILGLGLGSVPLMLTEFISNPFNVDAVEWDPEIILMAKKYLLDDFPFPISYFSIDALKYIETCQDEYDLIAIDLFSDDKISPEFQQTDFLEKCSNLLSPKGLLLYNRLSHLDIDKDASQKYGQDIFFKVFPKGFYLDTYGNWIFANRPELFTY
jgi:predicted membrane-bound spermidine synthase